MDETGIDTYLYRQYGWSQRGKPIIGEVSGHKFKRVGIVAAQMDGDRIEPLVYDGSMDSKLFEAWFEKRLLPALPKNSVIVMDNASFHRKVQLYRLVENTGHRLVFLPPFSPEYNPIEHFWNWLKQYLRKTLNNSIPFEQILWSAFQVG